MLIQLQWRNEWRLQSRNPLVWIALILVAAFGLIIAHGSPADPEADAIYALLRINLFVPAFILPFLAGLLAPHFYLRETDHDIGEVFGTYPVTLRQWLVARLGNFTLLLLGACLVAQVGFVAVLAEDRPGALGTMLVQSVLWFLVLHAPSCLIWASALAWLACRNANSGYLYAAAGLGWMGYLAIASLTGLPLIAGSDIVFPKLRQAMQVLDPHAATAMITAPPESWLLQWREANVAVGRLLWLTICVLMLRSIKEMPSLSSREANGPVSFHSSPGGPAKSRLAWLARGSSCHFAIHACYFARDRILFLIVCGWIALLLPEAYAGTDYAEELSRVVPDSRDALNRVVWDVMPAAGGLLLLYAADRICRLYPATRMHELYAATPHRAAHLLVVQLATLWAIAMFFMLLAGMSVAVAQLLAGSAIQPAEYLYQLGLSLPVFLLLTTLFVAAHGIIRPRFFANLACLFILVLGFTSLAPALGLEHPLWRPLFTQLAPPDHYWGFAGSLAGHGAYLLFWMAACTALFLIAIAGHHRTLAEPQRRFRQILSSRGAALALPLIGFAAFQGADIDHTLRQEGLLVSAQDRAELRADYERRYADWAVRPQPDVAAIRAHVDFHPRDQRVTLKARIRLINRSAVPIREVLVGRNRLGNGGTIALKGASVVRKDAVLGQTVFSLDPFLRPGAMVELDFAIDLAQSGLEPASFPFALRPEFSSVPAHAVLPVVGFKRELTIRDPALRVQQGLPKISLTPPSRLQESKRGSLLHDLVELESIVSTDAGYQAIAQGDLVRSWKESGRSYFSYRTTMPIRNHPVFFSVPWKPQSWSVGSVRIETFTPSPLVTENPNVLAMRDTLLWLGRDIAPYPGSAIRLVAIPDIGPGAYASPQIIQISHQLGFRAYPQVGAEFSQVYRRAAHETAHQWFGHMFGHGITEENAFMVESLAKYAELVLIERRYGSDAMRALVRFERDRYRQGRLDFDLAIAPLIDAEENEDMYSRATLVFACTRDKVGDGPILAALHQLAIRSRQHQAPMRSLDFINSLKTQIRGEFRPSVDALFLSRRPLDKVLKEAGCGQV